MDNLSTHKVAGVRAAIEAAGANLLYLPAHSPDLNPVEMAFAKLEILRRTKALRTMDELWSVLVPISDTFSQDECRNLSQARRLLPVRVNTLQCTNADHCDQLEP